MLPHTDWRPYGGDPPGPLGWILRAFRRPSWRMALLAVGLMLATVFTGGTQVWVFFLASAVAAIVLARRGERPVVQELYDLVPKVPGIDRHLVDVFVRRRGLLMGEDQGMVSDIDGWLYYEGLRSSFSLRGPDVRWIARVRQGAYELVLQDGTRLLLRPRADSEALGYLLGDWRAGAPPPEGGSRLPPTTRHFSALPEAVARLAAGSTALALGGFTLARLHVADAFFVLFSLLLLGFGLFQAALGFRAVFARR